MWPLLISKYFKHKKILQYAKEQRDNLQRQLAIVREQFKVKHATITDVNQAEGSYDVARTDYLSAVDTLFDREQVLNEIIGDHHGGLAKLKRHFPLVNPRPMRLAIWERKVVRDNLALNAARYGIDSARANIEVERGGHYPTVDAVANISRTREPNTSLQVATSQQFTNRSAGVAINFPFFQGGFVWSRTREAQAFYKQAIAEFENAYNQNIRIARQSYNGIVVGRRLVLAGYDAIKSNAEALKNTQEGYRVGTESVIDVIVQQTSLFQAQTQLTDEKYTYLLDIVRLELAAGSLSPRTLAQINAYLEHPKEPWQQHPWQHYDKRYRHYLSKKSYKAKDYQLKFEIPPKLIDHQQSVSKEKAKLHYYLSKKSHKAKDYQLKFEIPPKLIDHQQSVSKEKAKLHFSLEMHPS